MKLLQDLKAAEAILKSILLCLIHPLSYLKFKAKLVLQLTHAI